MNGETGQIILDEPVIGRVIGSVVTADLTGAGYQDLIVPTVHGWRSWTAGQGRR